MISSLPVWKQHLSWEALPSQSMSRAYGALRKGFIQLKLLWDMVAFTSNPGRPQPLIFDILVEVGCFILIVLSLVGAVKYG